MVEEVPSPASVRSFIEGFLKKRTSSATGPRQVAFYGGSFTANDREDQILYLEAVRPFLRSGMIDSIRISTRPDALDGEVLSLLKEYKVKTVEVGAQSMIDEVLALAHRGHTAREIALAISRLRQWDFEVGLHLMIGLPGDSYELFLQTLDRVIALKPDFLRIHPTLVLRGAPLAILWKNGGYAPLSLEDALHWLKKGVLTLEKFGIPIARMGLQPTPELERHLLAGPYHPALRQMVESEIAFDMATSLLRTSPEERRVRFFCNPKEISNMRGQKNGNLLRLKREFELEEVSIQGEEEIPRGSLLLRTARRDASIERRDLVC